MPHVLDNLRFAQRIAEEMVLVADREIFPSIHVAFLDQNTLQARVIQPLRESIEELPAFFT
ncbi:MAG: hypothetical protein O7G84_16250, partial [Gammaproteobacteria bacterium]|nr:hypothetical protein [Gammaproteobacteria bacterium]